MDTEFVLSSISDISEKSPSNKSISGNKTSQIYEPIWSKLLKSISEFYLESLKLLFQEKLRTVKHFGLTKVEFCDAINQIFGKELYIEEALSLFNEIDTGHNYVITWDQFLEFLRQNINVEEFPRMVLNNPIMIDIPHVQRDTIKKIVLLESEKYFSYVIGAIYGKVGLYNGNLELVTTYFIIMTKEDISKTDDDRRRRNRWITDALYIEDNSMIVYANSTRSITIYDASGLNHIPMWLVMGFPNIIECLTYSSQKISSHNKAILYLYFGYGNGKKISLQFKKQYDLFPKKQKDRLTVLYWQEVENDQEFLQFKSLNHNHKDNVRSIAFIEEQRKLISCSKDSQKSVIIDNMGSKNHSYVFKMHRGANCFAYSSILNILITGSEDGLVRIWNSVATQKPILATSAHKHGIVDVAIFSVIGFFISISRDAELRLWEIKEFKCVQVIKIKFPCFHEKQTIEWGVKCIFRGPKRQNKREIANRNVPQNKEWFLQDDDDIEIAATKNDNKMNIFEDFWERSNILIICSNNLCQINLNFYDDKTRNLDRPVLPMQPLLNSVLIPNDWILNDLDKISGKSGEVKAELEDSEEFKIKVAKHIEELKFVLDRNLTSFINKNHETNYKLVQLEDQKQKMQFYVENGAPFLALALHETDELQVGKNLPVPNKPKIEKLVMQTRSVLSNAKARTVIFSDRSSSTKSPRSSRSSFVDFN